MIRYIKSFFLTSSPDKTKFLNGDKPNETTFRKLFDSIPFIKERSDRAKIYGTDQCPQGLVVKNTNEQVKTRVNPMDTDSSGLPYSFAIDAENLPEVSSQYTKDVNSDDVLLVNYPSILSGGINVEEDRTNKKRSIWKIALDTYFVRWIIAKVRKIDLLEKLTFVSSPLPNIVNDSTYAFQNTVRNLLQVKVEEVIATDGSKTYWFNITPEFLSELNRHIVDNPGNKGNVPVYDNIRQTLNGTNRIVYNNTSEVQTFHYNPPTSNVVPTPLQRINIGDNVKLDRDRKELLTTVYGDYVDIGRRSFINEFGAKSTANIIGNGAIKNLYGLCSAEPSLCDFRNDILNNIYRPITSVCDPDAGVLPMNFMMGIYPTTSWVNDNGAYKYKTSLKIWYTDINPDPNGGIGIFRLWLENDFNGNIVKMETGKMGS